MKHGVDDDDDARPAFPPAFSLQAVRHGVAPLDKIKFLSSFDSSKFSYAEFPLSSLDVYKS